MASRRESNGRGYDLGANGTAGSSLPPLRPPERHAGHLDAIFSFWRVPRYAGRAPVFPRLLGSPFAFHQPYTGVSTRHLGVKELPSG